MQRGCGLCWFHCSLASPPRRVPSATRTGSRQRTRGGTRRTVSGSAPGPQRGPVLWSPAVQAAVKHASKGSVLSGSCAAGAS